MGLKQGIQIRVFIVFNINRFQFLFFVKQCGNISIMKTQYVIKSNGFFYFCHNVVHTWRVLFQKQHSQTAQKTLLLVALISFSQDSFSIKKGSVLLMCPQKVHHWLLNHTIATQIQRKFILVDVIGEHSLFACCFHVFQKGQYIILIR